MTNHVTESISSGHPLYAFSSLQDFIADFSELQKLMSSGEIEFFFAACHFHCHG